MIFRETAVGQGNSALDLRESEGVAVKIDASGNVTPVTSAADLPAGVVHIGADVNMPTTYIMTAYAGIVGIKLDDAPGVINQGDPLVISATGKWKSKPASGACVIAAYAAEGGGEGGQLLLATLCAPQRITA